MISSLLLCAGLICCLGGKKATDYMDTAVMSHDIGLQDLDIIHQHASFRRSDVELRTLERLELFLLHELVQRHSSFYDILLQYLRKAILVGRLKLFVRCFGPCGVGLTYGRPGTLIEAVSGAPAIKSAMLTVTVDYETSAPLAPTT